MNVVIAVGLVMLAGLALLIGVLQANRSAQERAWRGIAEGRRRNWEMARRLDEVRDAQDYCRDCPFRPRGPDNRD